MELGGYLTVSTGLDPDVEGTLGFLTTVGVVAARMGLVDVMLDNGSPDHAETSEEEAGGDTLKRREVDLPLAELRVDEAVDNWDEDDEGDGVQVVKNIVGNSIELHGGGLRSQVVVHLVV